MISSELAPLPKDSAAGSLISWFASSSFFCLEIAIIETMSQS